MVLRGAVLTPDHRLARASSSHATSDICTYRVHQAGSRASGFPDGDGAEEYEPSQPLHDFTTSDAPAGAVAGPPVPPPTAGRERREALAHNRGRARGTRDESDPSEPVPDDDDDDEMSEGEEATSPQSESSEDGDDDTGLDSEDRDDVEAGSVASSDTGASDSGIDGDSSESMPRKRTKRASRS
ncbi:nucleolar transcription factor 1-like [Camellia sinensis]|uniref:nucleolar transcription factor 1-like n=1 Tax=Camellia sinensis TaxID=4442 RepID=UPI0010364D71|nr:nucleolar transcription factor 1-like [Camellia sinensis]